METLGDGDGGIPLPRFFHSRRTPSLLTSSLVLFPQLSAKRHMMCAHFENFTGLTVHHSSTVTFLPLLSSL